MKREFIVFFEHTHYGYYTLTVDAEDIVKALKDFSENYAYNEIYGIMEKK
jgi:predicted transcriptional regulator